jgi:hypothetical protein
MDHPQTVEEIVSMGYFAVPKSDPVTAVLTDKHHTARLGLDDVVSQIRSRYEIFETNLEEIEQAKCAAVNHLLTSEAEQGKPADGKQLYAVQKQMQKLYEQARFERVSLWQDVSKLRLAVPELAGSYLSTYRKVKLMDEEEGDSE